ncbi:arsenate reductase family protein [Xanthomarina gelatinilytica]|uniref:arsenate reductase family protein n=1 Tax=Xanthomarina gelatinilytica TaxID=1137281 RepID=UPI003515F73D
MGTIATDKKKLILYYHPETSIGKQAYAFALASNKKILAIDISKTKITGTQWLEISENLNTILSKLVNLEHPEFTNNYDSGLSLDKDDWIKVLQKHPETLRCPILVDGKNYHLIETPSKVSKLIEKEETAEDPRSKE